MPYSSQQGAVYPGDESTHRFELALSMRLHYCDSGKTQGDHLALCKPASSGIGNHWFHLGGADGDGGHYCHINRGCCARHDRHYQ